jgi:hypothetical protein
MPTIEEQYSEFVQRGQEATTAILEAWNRSVQDVTSRASTSVTNADLVAMIDQTFDFANQVLTVQRDLTKQFVTTSAAATEEAVLKANKAINEAASAAKGAVKNRA